MATKAQKVLQIEESVKELQQSESVIILDFTGLSANDMNILRKSLHAIGGSLYVVKKRLLKFVFEKEGMEFEPKSFSGQTGVVFSPKDMVETAGAVYTFSKTRNLLKISGGFSVSEKKFISGEDVKRIGQLPSREVLLGQLVYMISSPIRSFLFVLNEKSKQTATN